MIGISAYALMAGLIGQSPDAPPQTVPTQLEDVVVEGRVLDDAARDFVRSVGDAPPLGALPARWTKPLCISVVNLKAPFGQQMVDGIARTAVDLGLEVGGPGCASNVLIVGTDDGPQTARYLVDGARDRFRSQVDRANKDLQALSRFQESNAPVRWWHISFPRLRETGQFAGRGGGVRMPGTIAGSDGGGGSNISVVSVGGASSLIAPTLRYDIETVTVVVDFSKTEAVSMSALTDYVAMVVLAQVDPRADFSGRPTILNLFNASMEVDHFTDWDEDYLRAVYTMDLGRTTPAAHEAMVARRLANLQRDRQRKEVDPLEAN